MKQLLNFIGRGSAFNQNEGCNSAYLIKNNRLYLFDCGGDTFKRLQKLNILNNLKSINVCITHTHPDHCGSLGDLIFYCYFVLKIPIAVISGINLISLLTIYGINTNMYDSIILNKNYIFKLNDINISIVPQIHSEGLKSFGYIIYYDNNKLFYSGDSSEFNNKVLNDIDTFDQIYQDTCGVDYDGNVHLSLNKLKAIIPIKYRNKIYCMHLDNAIKEKDIIENGFNVVRTKE